MLCTNTDVLETLKNIYKSAGKFDDQHKYNAMIEAATVSTPMGFTNNSKILSGQYVPEKKLRGNFSISLQRYWTSNQIQLYAGYVLLNQSARQSEQAVCCVPIYQNDASIPKSTNVLKTIFTNRLYNILRFCNLQYLMIL